MGVLGWTPDVFWNASFREYNLAMSGFKRFNCPPENKYNSSITKEEYDEIQELFAQERNKNNG